MNHNATLGSLKKILRKSDTLRDLYGTYRIFRSWVKYINNRPYKDAIISLGSNSSKNFSSFFVQVEKIRREKFQALGINIPSTDKADKDGVDWLNFLRSEGLKNGNSVLDYGCGSLRLGKTLISFLDANKYVGVDISDHFYTLGIENYVKQDLIALKKPRFFVINSEEYEEKLEAEKFDFIYSQWVMCHVPPDQLGKYFDNIFKLMGPNSVLYFDFTNSILTLRQNALTWGYPSRKIKKLITDRGFSFEPILGGMLKVRKK